MIYISHRGNLRKKNELGENSPEKINFCLSLGYEVEIDVWYIGDSFFLGHDRPEYEIKQEYLLNDKLWCHAKNIEALQKLKEINVKNHFWHEEDSYTLTSSGAIWTYPGKKLVKDSICVLPEIQMYDILDLNNCYGICSDHIEIYKEKLDK